MSSPDEPLFDSAADMLNRIAALVADLNALPGIRARVDVNITITPELADGD
jgi:hypothetical protein